MDVKVNLQFGPNRNAGLDVSANWVQVYYESLVGFLNLKGTLPNGAAINKNYAPDGMLQFHTPAEHTFSDTRFDVEMQIPFTEPTSGSKARVSVFFNVYSNNAEDENSFIQALNLDNPNGEIDRLPLQQLLQEVDPGHVWYYEGSLSYPPCTENVAWFLLVNPQSISSV